MKSTAKTWLAEAKRLVDAALIAFVEEKVRAASAVDPEAEALATEIRGLSTRAGKRLRGGLVLLGHRVAGGTSDEPVLPAAVAFELLQTHLLIQDDWMDRDDLRRGGPSVHRAFADRLGDEHLGASLAILASDVAWAWALESLLAAEVPPERSREAARLFASIETEVVYGQLLDVLGAAETEKIHRLKTAGYTITGPLCLGATLGGASAPLLDALRRFANPLGVAFQLRDDLLGVFGAPEKTGKPVGADLRAGKRTMLVSLAERLLFGDERVSLELVLGNALAPDSELARLTEILEERGIRTRVEEKAAALEAEARAAVGEVARVSGRRVDELEGLVELMAERAE